MVTITDNKSKLKQLITFEDIRDVENVITTIKDNIVSLIDFQIPVTCYADIENQQIIERPATFDLPIFFAHVESIATTLQLQESKMYQFLIQYIQAERMNKNNIIAQLDLLITKMDELKMMVKVMENWPRD